MAKTKLIIVEGIPGSGKTTTASITNDILKNFNIASKLYLEGNTEHPADYDTYSYLTVKEWEQLLSTYQEMEPILSSIAEESKYGYLIPRFKLEEDIPDEPANKLWKKDVYEIPLDIHMKLIFERWERYRNQALNTEDIYVFECCFIQNPVTIAMIKYGASDEVIMSYIQKLEKIIEPLNPILLYVDQADLEISFKKAIEERPKEWSEGFMNYYNNQGFGKQLGVTGMVGTLRVLNARKQLESRIVESLTMRKYIIDNSHFDMNQFRRVLDELISKNIVN